MQIIGEKINGTRKHVGQAILERDAGFIQDLARRQTEAGATWLDVNAGTFPEREPDDLAWLVETVQAASDLPLVLDSANPATLAQALTCTRKTPMINSISGEPARLEGVLPLVVAHNCPVVALALDGKQIPKTAEGRWEIITRLIQATRAAGIPDERVYLDPLAMTLSTDQDGANTALTTIRRIRQEIPQAHITLGLSNISFGLPARSLINRVFLTLALQAGLDCAIIDPLDRELIATLIAAEMVLGRDKHCLAYTRAFRKGLLTPKEAD